MERTLPGNRRIVATERGRGFYERPYIQRGGRTYIQRTYIEHGHQYAVVYRTYYYRGIPYYGYVPAYYYQPGFYGWAYNPWPAPIAYSWGWAPEPWYGYYGYYFAPAPVYPSAALWLTDFVLAENLRAAFEERSERDQNRVSDASQPAQSTDKQSTLSPEVKQAIAEEVTQQLSVEQKAAQSPAHLQPESEEPPALDPKLRIFVVSSSLDVLAEGGQECSLSSGDVILRTGNEILDGNKVEVSVQSSQRGDCASGTTNADPTFNRAGLSLVPQEPHTTEVGRHSYSGCATPTSGIVAP